MHLALEQLALNEIVLTDGISVQVNLPATAGDMGVLANHVPTIQQLKPGVVEVMDGGNETKSFFGMTSNTPISIQN